MADNEAPVATPKKRNRPAKKRNKNDVSKNNAQKSTSTPSSEPISGKGGRFANDKTDASVMPKTDGCVTPRKDTPRTDTPRTYTPRTDTPRTDTPKTDTRVTPNEGRSSATPEKKNTNQRSFQRNFQEAKKKNNNSAKKVNSTKVENQGTIKPQLVGESSNKTEPSHNDRSHREERYQTENQRRESYYQMDYQRRQIEEDRKRKWHEYFLSKPHELLQLDRNKVILLKTVEKNRPQAQFYCKICKYYCDNMSVVAAHIRKTAHIRQLQDYNEEATIREMPQMTKDQMGVLHRFLMRQVTLNTMDPLHLEIRRTIGVLVSDLVSSNLPGCSTRLFGSSIHGLGLKTSDVNIDLQVPEGSLPPAMLKEVASLLRTSPHFVDVVENFHCEFPFISFKYKNSGEICSLSLNNERAVSLAILLSKYTPLDPRLTQLATLFRLWGQITQTDKAQDGTWPGYAFYLLTIFYLQQCRDPVLPVLNDLLANGDESESNNTAKVLSMDISEIKQKWITSNKQTLGSLWLGLLRFYTIEFNYTEYMVCIDSFALKPRKTRKLFIVDPFLPTRNVARSISSNATFYYIMGCLMTTCRYFSIPQTKFGPLFGEIYTVAAKYHPELEALLQDHDRINSHLIHLIMKLDSAFFNQPRGDIQQCIKDVMHMIHNHDFRNVDNIPLTYLERNCVPPRHQYREMSVSPKDAQQLVSSFSAKYVDYFLVPDNFTGGEKVPKICGVCKHEGHLKDDCPEEKLPPLDPLPQLSIDWSLLLDKLCYHIFDKWKQSDEDFQKREKICQELQEFIGDLYPTAKLELFGSTKNGFGLKGSDMDICLTFEDNKTGEGLDTRAFIEVLYRLLSSFKELQNLLPIATAKVPIVKFTHKTTKLDGDISLYNVLALENSKLLCTYSQIDMRTRVLGYMMKRFSKVCRIGDASKGSLSSYAYTLLVIYFLQRCDPPVLPVLQELTEDGGPPPKHIVEGCNAYFFSDLSKLDEVWPGRYKNEMDVGHLWLNLLVFYTEQFDSLNNVICIRCSRTVTKFEKLWISKGIAIEDPFDLTHNLGSALSRKMSLYIIKALRKGRNHFGRPAKLPSLTPRDIEAYFMNVKELTDGEPPNDRGCRICKSIGHKERECPEKKKKGRKNKKNRNKSQNETPAKKSPSSEDDEDDDPDDFSDSENGSSDQEDDPLRLAQRRIVNSPVKSGTSTPSKQNREGTSNSSLQTPHASKPSPSKKVERRNIGFQATKPTVPKPGFAVQDQSRVSGSPVGNFPLQPKNANSMQRIANPQYVAMNHNMSGPPIAPKSEMGFVPHNQMSVNTPPLISTVVFSNSKLSTDPVPKPVTPVRYSFPPAQETTRPPPGFIPLSQSPQFSSPHDQKTQGQKGWVIDHVVTCRPSLQYLNTPMNTNVTTPMNTNVNTPMNTNVKFPYVPVPIVRPINASMHPFPPPTGVTPHPPIGPTFNNLQVLGILGPTEQLIWGQSSPPATQPPPFPTQTPQTHTHDAPQAKVQIYNDVSSLKNTDEQLIQLDPSKKESNINSIQNKPTQHPFSSNTTILNKTT